MLIQRWRIEILGGIRLFRGDRSISRFQSRKVASLLAYLAMHPDHPHTREELVSLLWPDDDVEAARNRLRVGLSSLRQQLEPLGTPRGGVISADRTEVRLEPASVTCDAVEFERAAKEAQESPPERQRDLLLRCAETYGGELLPGFTDPWVLTQRERLAEEYIQALRRLVRLLAQDRDCERALLYARRAVEVDPYREEAHRDLMRLYFAVGQAAAAQRQYEELERLLREGLDSEPCSATRKLARQISEAVGRAPRTAATHGPARRPAPAASAAPEPTSPARPALPLFLTRFFGRERELGDLRSLLATGPEQRRLVTLSGPGGVGKTRLATAVAEALRPNLADRVWFVALGDLADSRLIPDSIVAAMGIRRSPGADSWSEALRTLAAGPALLLLDNLEHLAADAAPIIEEILAACPALACLVTSRRTLGIPGEQDYPLLPLPVPAMERAAAPGPDSTESACDLEGLLAYPSVQLLLDRGQAADPEFHLSPRNAADIADLCRRLEGIPLAIELAAARARALTPAQMVAHLAHRFDLLVNRRADKSLRHRSLRAALEWSYALLSPELRRLLARLSVFAGGWTIQSASAICCEDSGGMPAPVSSESEEAAPDLVMLGQLEELAANSLILAAEDEAGIRFRMLETLREFASERLDLHEREHVTRRYIDYFVDLAESAIPHLRGSEQSFWLRRLYAERDNLRAVHDLCLVREDGGDSGLRLTHALYRFWSGHGLFTEGRRRAAESLAHPGAQEPSPLRADALFMAGSLAIDQEDLDAADALASEALAVADPTPYQRGVALATGLLGLVALRRGELGRASEFLGRSMEAHRDLGDEFSEAAARTNLAVAEQNLGRYDVAKKLHEQSLEYSVARGNRWVMAKIVGNLGIIAERQGKTSEAQALYLRSLELNRELGDLLGVANALGNLGVLAGSTGDYQLASERFGEALRYFEQLNMRRSVAMVKDCLGSLAAQQGDNITARRLHAGSLELLRAIGSRVAAIDAACNLAKAHLALGEGDQARDVLAEALQVCKESGNQAGLAQLLDSLAAVEATGGSHERAARLLGASDSVRGSAGAQIPHALVSSRAETIERVKAALGEVEFDSAHAAGRTARLSDALLCAGISC